MGKNGICVKVYMNKESFLEYIKIAERMQTRRGGLIPFTQKKNGMPGQVLANTDGLSKAFKKGIVYWSENEAERTKAKAELLAKKKQLEEEERRLEGK